MNTVRAISVVSVLGAIGCVALQDKEARDTGGGEAQPATGHITLDWSSSRLGSSATDVMENANVHSYQELQQRGFYRAVAADSARQGPPELDWNIPTDAPVTASGAIYTANFTSASSNDALFFATNASAKGITSATGAASIANYAAGMATGNLFKLKFLYNTTPTVAWYANLGAGVDGSGLALSNSGGRVFALTSTTLHCFLTSQSGEASTATGAALTVAANAASECVGYPVTPGGTFSKSSPWVDAGIGAVYVANLSGQLFRYDLGGNKQWTLTLGAGAAIHSDPVEYNNTIYIGSDSGSVYVVNDTATGSTTPATPTAFSLGSTAIYGGGAIDTATNLIYFAVGDALHSGNLTNATQVTRSLGTGNTGIIWSSPSIDYTNGYVYVAFNNSIIKSVSPFTTSSAVYITPTAYQSSDTTYPHSTPLPFNNAVFVGTSGSGGTGGGGSLEDYSCTASAAAPGLTSVTTPYGGRTGTAATSDTTPVVDYSTGNANFGYSTTSGTGGFVQISMSALTAAKLCPNGSASETNAACGATAPACVSSSTCADRPSNAGTTVCGVFTENYSTQATITCPTGTTIVGVSFASYGTPTGTCAGNNLAIDTTCHSSTSQSAFLAACGGLNSCSFYADSGVFGTPCAAAQGSKFFAVKAICDTGNTKTCSGAHLQGAACSNGTTCAGTCDPGYTDCNANKLTDGCEKNTAGDTSNCGGCGTVCSTSHVLTTACTSGTCTGTCASGFADCNANKQTDGCETATSCASCCGVACGTGTACIEGVCTASTTTCATADENTSLTLTCPPGTVMTGFPYASYGNPSGSCATSFANGTCNGSNSMSVVSSACLNNNTCTVSASNGTFTDPCVGTFKRLYVKATCSASATCP